MIVAVWIAFLFMWLVYPIYCAAIGFKAQKRLSLGYVVCAILGLLIFIDKIPWLERDFRLILLNGALFSGFAWQFYKTKAKHKLRFSLLIQMLMISVYAFMTTTAICDWLNLRLFGWSDDTTGLVLGGVVVALLIGWMTKSFKKPHL